MKKSPIFVALITIAAFFTSLSALTIADHGSYIALRAPHNPSDAKSHVSIITPQETINCDPAHVLLQAFLYDPVNRKANKLGFMLLSQVPKAGLPFLWDSPSTREPNAHYRIYAYHVKPGTREIIKKISSISRIITITPGTPEQRASTRSYAPFLLKSKRTVRTKKPSNTLPLIIGSLCLIGGASIALACYRHFSKQTISPQENNSNASQQDTGNLQHPDKKIKNFSVLKDILDNKLTSEDKDFIRNFRKISWIDDHGFARQFLHLVRVKELVKKNLRLIQQLDTSTDEFRGLSKDEQGIITIINNAINTSIQFYGSSPYQQDNLKVRAEKIAQLHEFINDPTTSNTESDELIKERNFAEEQKIILQNSFEKYYNALSTGEYISPPDIQRFNPDNSAQEWGRKQKKSLQEIFRISWLGDPSPHPVLPQKEQGYADTIVELRGISEMEKIIHYNNTQHAQNYSRDYRCLIINPSPCIWDFMVLQDRQLYCHGLINRKLDRDGAIAKIIQNTAPLRKAVYTRYYTAATGGQDIDKLRAQNALLRSLKEYLSSQELEIYHRIAIDTADGVFRAYKQGFEHLRTILSTAVDFSELDDPEEFKWTGGFSHLYSCDGKTE